MVAASRVFLLVAENKSYADVIGSSSAPFLNSLGTKYSIASNYFANAHPSLPNYFMLTTGQLIASDDNFSGVVDVDNVVRELAKAGHSWRVYAESLPSEGALGSGKPPYARWHNPFVYFSDVANDPAQWGNIVPFSQFAGDLAANTLPDYVYLLPDDSHNSHDCPNGTAACVTQMDQWLQANIQPLIDSPAFQQGGLLVITFDESEDSDVQFGGGHIATIIAGPHVKAGYTSTTFYQHPSVLRLTLQALGITSYPGAAATAPDMTEFFH